MKRIVQFLGAALAMMPAVAAAVDYSLDSSTFMRFQQMAAPGFEKKFLAPATQYVTMDATKVGVEGLSLHFYGWGYANLGDVTTDESRLDGNLTYFYLSYRLPQFNTQMKAGRFFVVEGMPLQQIDGVSLRSDLPLGFSASVYGGAPSHLDYKYDNTGNWIAGGRLSKRFAGFAEVGVSGVHETGLNAVTTGVSPTTVTSQHNSHQLLGGDVWLSPARILEIAGHTYYNTITSGIAEHSYQLTLTPARMLILAGDYSEQNPKDYFTTTNIPSLFNPIESDKFRRYGGRVTVIPVKTFEVSADYHRFNREVTGNSNRYGIDLRASFVDKKVRTGLSYHRVEGARMVTTAGDNAATGLHEMRAYAMYDAHPSIVSLEGICHLYNEKINGRDTVIEVLTSAGYRFTPSLLLSADISYGQTPELNDEVKGLVKLVYNFTTETKGARK